MNSNEQHNQITVKPTTDPCSATPPLSQKYYFVRSALSDYLGSQQLYFTQALLGTVDRWVLHDHKTVPAAAYIRVTDLITVGIEKRVVEECVRDFNILDSSHRYKTSTVEVNKGYPIKVSPLIAMFLALHEIRHIPQVEAQKRLANEILLPEIIEKLKKGNRPMAHIVNICMDMKLHQDILKLPLIKEGFDQYESLMKEYQIEEEKKRLTDQLNQVDARTKEMLMETINPHIKEMEAKIRSSQPSAVLELFDKYFPEQDEGATDITNKDYENMSWAELVNLAYLRKKQEHEKQKDQNKKQKDQNKEQQGEGNQNKGQQGEGNQNKGKRYNKNKLFDEEEEGGGGGEGDLENEGRLDEHMWGDSSGEEEGDLQLRRQRRLEQAMREAEYEGKKMAGKMAGCHAGDLALFVKEVDSPNKELIKLLSKIKSKVKTLADKPSHELSWRVARSRGGFCLPTERISQGKKKKSTVVLVLDTSGSMWDEETLTASVSVGRGLMKTGKLAAMYQCDTELFRCDNQLSTPTGRSSGTVGIVGGGGTDLSPKHIKQIREDLSTSKKKGSGSSKPSKISDNEVLDVVYVTDGYVDLSDLKADPKVRLHVVINNLGELELKGK